jgi:glucose-1-phosphate cytidylyltransferase
MNAKFLNFIKNSQTFLEKEPLERATKQKQLAAFKHRGFWQCMDTKRDKDKLDEILKKNII